MCFGSPGRGLSVQVKTAVRPTSNQYNHESENFNRLASTDAVGTSNNSLATNNMQSHYTMNQSVFVDEEDDNDKVEEEVLRPVVHSVSGIL